MKFLLAAVNAKYIHSNPAIYSLRAYAGEELRQYVELAEYTINQPMADILADLYGRKPDVIGFSCYIWNWRLVRELLGELPKLLPDTEIWLGGPEVSYDADVILRKYPQLTGIMVGEGEATFRELLGYYAAGATADKREDTEPEGIVTARCGDMEPESIATAGCGAMEPESIAAARCGDTEPESIATAGCWDTEPESIATVGCGDMEPENIATAGCWDMESESIVTAGCGDMEADSSEGKCPIATAEANGRRQWTGRDAGRLADIPGLCLPTGYTPCRSLTDLSAIPFLYDDLAPFENRIVYYESSRGCPFRCSYCLSSIDKQVRLRDMGIVKKELRFFLDHKVKQVKFIDRTFNCSHAHTMAVWSYLLKHDNGVTNFHFEISADILREDEIALLNDLRPGLAQLEIGVQTVNPKTLEAIRRVMDVDKLESIVAAIRQGGNVHLHLDLIAGLPYEDYESFGRSFDRVYGMHPHQLQLGFLKVLKGSEMWERAGEYGIQYLEQPPYEVLCTKWLSYRDMLRLKRIEEMVELYYNSGQFTHTLPFLEKAFPGPFALYEALAEFYEERGYFTVSPARVYRYQALLDFAVTYDGERREIYRELLTFDMYLRENLKSRPDFAPEREDVREAVRDFYRREEKERKYLPNYGEYDRRQLARMTHLEPFVYPVWDKAWTEERAVRSEEDGTAYNLVLFDYQKRSPLNHEAFVQVLPRKPQP
ncbi:MAG: DUF4080 domain-containing protein [Lachnospiraceae bacterium]|nr:DUF4080 domain-containing protein [Lachnospiraceae bacterium]